MSLLAIQIAAVKFSVEMVAAEVKQVKVIATDLDAALKDGEAAVRRKVKDCVKYADAARERAEKAKANK